MRDDLLRWFDAAARPLPWRSAHADGPVGRALARDRTYVIWVVETLSQQTRIATVAARLPGFLARFPDLATLAYADLDEVLAAWSGLGYYRRARALHAAARRVAHDLGGRWPSTVREWRRLPGVGPYTAAAVAAQALGLPTIALDGNVRRVGARMLGVASVDDATLRAALEAALLGDAGNGGADAGNGGADAGNGGADAGNGGADAGNGGADAEHGGTGTRGPDGRGARVAEALVELGAMLCTPRSPDCGRCPLRPGCAAAASGRPDRFPVAKARRPPATRELHAWVVLRADAVQGHLVALERRPDTGLWAGLWGPPWRDEAPATGASRAAAFRHALTHRRIEAVVWLADDPPADAHVRWTALGAGATVGMAEIDRKALAHVVAALERGPGLAPPAPRPAVG